MKIKFLLLLWLSFMCIGCKSEGGGEGGGERCINEVIAENYNVAEIVCEQAYNEGLYKFGEKHPETLLAQMGLLTTYVNFERYNDAEPLALSLLERLNIAFNKYYSSPSKKDFKNRDEIFARVYYAIALIHEKQGKLKQSIDDWKVLYDWTKQFSDSEFIADQFLSSVAVADLCLQEKRFDESKYYFKIAEELYARYGTTGKLNADDIEAYEDLSHDIKPYLTNP